VRADFYDPLIGHQEVKSLLPTRQVLLGKMLRSELESTIVEQNRVERRRGNGKSQRLAFCASALAEAL
jgi:hypothetical protein